VAAHRKRPLPACRMADLLAQRKRELLDAEVELTPRVFEQAWAECWELMIGERAYPHATEHRRQWKATLIACKSEHRASFLGRATPFGRLADVLMAAAARQEIEMSPADLVRAILGAVGAYGATGDDEAPEVAQEAMRA
jgi:hypothetical protein